MGVTSLEVMYQITCIFFWSFKRLYTTFYFLTCSSTPQDLNKKILFYKNESKSIMYITFKWIPMTWPHFVERERHTPFCPFFGRPHWTQQNPFFSLLCLHLLVHQFTGLTKLRPPCSNHNGLIYEAEICPGGQGFVSSCACVCLGSRHVEFITDNCK